MQYEPSIPSVEPGLSPGLATLAVRGDRITGSIRTPSGAMYRLRPLGDGEAAVILLDYEAMPEDYPPEPVPSGRGAMTVRPTATPKAQTTAQPQTKPGARAEAAKVKQVERRARLATRTMTQLRPTALAVAGRFRLRSDLVVQLMPTADVLAAYTASAQSVSGETATAFAHDRGFIKPAASGRRRTIMGYRCASHQCDPQLHYWSTPLVTCAGSAAGAATCEDNTRVWNERARTVPGFR